MSKPRSVLISGFKLLVFLTVVYAHLEKCAVLEFLHLTENICIKENDFVNLTFWLNISGCKPSDTLYRLTVKIKTDKNITDDEGRLAVIKGTCSVTTGKLFRCVSPAGPVELYRKVNRSHIEIEWKWWWKENGLYTYRNKTLNITACALPSVTNLTVNGQESNGTYTTDVGQNISIYCAFDKGNPPTTFRLLDRNGGEIDVAKDESHIIHSLVAVSCEEDWPLIQCEGTKSTENKFVSLLVRCPPQFTDVAPKFINPDVNDHVTLKIKAYSTIVRGCLLTRASTEENFRQKVNCSLYGNPPNLILNITLHDEVKLIRGSWTLNVTNDIGSGEIVLTFIAASGNTSRIVVIIGMICSAAVLTIVVFFVIQRSRKQNEGKRTRPSAGNRDDSRESMIVNDLYGTTSDGGHVSLVSVRNDNNVNHANEYHLVYFPQPTLTELDVLALPLRSDRSHVQSGGVDTVSRNCESQDDEISDYIVPTMTMEKVPTTGHKNTQELIYGDLDFSHVTGTDIIRGSNGETEYTEINHTAIVPPPRDHKKKKTDKRESRKDGKYMRLDRWPPETSSKETITLRSTSYSVRRK